MATLNIGPLERVFVDWTVENLPVDVPVEFRINGGPWTTVAFGRLTPSVLRAVIAGPKAPNDGEPVTAVTRPGSNTYDIRITDANPEVIAYSGTIWTI